MAAYQQPALNALADPTRLAILRSLALHPLPVSELATAFPISRPAISQHLRILSDAGLVHASSQGTRRIYSVDPAGLKALKAHYDRFWNSVLGEFKSAAEATPQPETKETEHAEHARKRRRPNSRR